MIFAFLGQNWL